MLRGNFDTVQEALIASIPYICFFLGSTSIVFLVAGVNTVSELFVRSVQEFASKIRVAGLLADDPALRGCVIHKKPVLGTIEELWEILQSLEVHGVSVDRIVVAMPGERLRPHALKTLLDLEKSSGIVVHFLSERLGLEDFSKAPSVSSTRER